MVKTHDGAIRDSIALSAISGVLGTIAMYIIGIPLYFLKLSETIYLLYSIEYFVSHDTSRTTFGFIAGMIVGLIVGSALAFGFIMILKIFGTDWFYLKSFAYGAIMWFVWVGLTRAFTRTENYLFDNLGSNILLLVESIIYSVATAYFMKRYGHLEITPDDNNLA